jgi:uncharacterized membrane protein
LSNTINEDKLNQLIIKIIIEKKPQNAGQLINLVLEEVVVSEKRILDALNYLNESKIIKMERSDFQKLAFSSFLKTREALWYWLVMTTNLLAFISVFIIPVDAYPFSFLRNILGLLFILFFPGYSFVRLMFNKEKPIKQLSDSLESVEHLASSIGVSIALSSIVGLMLYYTPLGLGLVSITFSLFLLTLILSNASVVREFRSKFK